MYGPMVAPVHNFRQFSFIFWGRTRSSEAGMGGGAQRPVWRDNEPKRTGARSARPRTRGLNPLVVNNLQNVFNGMSAVQRYFPVPKYLSTVRM